MCTPHFAQSHQRFCYKRTTYDTKKDDLFSAALTDVSFFAQVRQARRDVEAQKAAIDREIRSYGARHSQMYMLEPFAESSLSFDYIIQLARISIAPWTVQSTADSDNCISAAYS